MSDLFKGKSGFWFTNLKKYKKNEFSFYKLILSFIYLKIF